MAEANKNTVAVPQLSGRLLAKNTIFNLSGQLLPMLVAVLTIPIIVKSLGTDRFGVLTLAWMVVGYFSLFDMRLGRATTKFVAEYLGEGDSSKINHLIWTSFLMLAGFGLLGTIIALALTPWLVNSLLNIPTDLLAESTRTFYLLAFSIPIVSMTAGIRGVLEAQQRFDYINYVKVPIAVSSFLSPLLVIPFSTSLFPIVGVLVLSRLGGLLAYFVFCLRTTPGLIHPRILNFKYVKTLLGYGGWLTISSVVWPLMTYMDRFVIGAMLTMTAVAYYVTPYELIAKLMVISGSVLSVMFPAFSMCSKGKHEKLLSLFQNTVRYLLIILVPIVFVIIIMAKPFFQVWLGNEFVMHSVLILQLLALGKLINSVSQVPSSAIQAMGRPDITAKLHLIELPVYLVMLWFFINSMGIVGAAVAWLVRVVIDSSLYFLIFYRLSPVKGGRRPAFKLNILVWAAFMIGGAFVIAMTAGIYLKILLVIAGLGLTAHICWRSFLEEDEKIYLRNILIKLRIGKSVKPAQASPNSNLKKRNEYSIQKLIRSVYFRNKGQILNRLDGYRQRQNHPVSELRKFQLEKIDRLLNHAFKNVPYYHGLLAKTDLLVGGEIRVRDFEQFCQIPLMTKAIIRKQGNSLYSRDHALRKSYMNSSGGSTGEPVRILQDKNYLIARRAGFLLAKGWRGVGPFDSEVIIWGSELDTFKGKKPLKSHIQDFLRNRIMINSFKMTTDDMMKYIGILNRHKPAMIRAYADSIYEIAAFARKNNIRIEPQRAIHAAACTLHDFMRKAIEEVFNCPVYNHYGCREVGGIASECGRHNGLHLLMENNYVEVLDSNGKPCKPGDEGRIVVTCLNNYSMPVIRYEIGDLGVFADGDDCACGCTYPRLASVNGRTSEVFRTRDGRVISPIYFAHLLGVVYKDSSIKRFQIVQKDYDKVQIKMVRQSEAGEKLLDDIRGKVRIVMGKDCDVEYKFVDNIEETATGKFRHTISEVK